MKGGKKAARGEDPGMHATTKPWRGALAALVLAATAPAAGAEPVSLLFASLSPGGSANSGYFSRWATTVGAASGDTIKVEVRDGYQIAGFANIYDRIASDVVQIGWVLPGAIGGKYPFTRVAALPFQPDDIEATSVALWRLYK